MSIKRLSMRMFMRRTRFSLMNWINFRESKGNSCENLNFSLDSRHYEVHLFFFRGGCEYEGSSWGERGESC